MLSLTKAEKDRRYLYKVSKGNPQAILVAIDEIRRIADEALKSTLDVSQQKAFARLSQAIQQLEAAYAERLRSIETSLDRIIAEKVALVEPRKGERGPKGDSPTTAELLMLIEPLIPYIKDGQDGVTPGKDALIEILRPLIAEHMSNIDMHGKVEEMEKARKDEIEALITKQVAEKISQIKRFGGGGSGDRVKAGSGISVTTNVIGQKVITATSALAVETPTGTVDGSNDTFTVTAEPQYVVADGITYFDGAGYTYAALSITMDVPPSSSIRAII